MMRLDERFLLLVAGHLGSLAELLRFCSEHLGVAPSIGVTIGVGPLSITCWSESMSTGGGPNVTVEPAAVGTSYPVRVNGVKDKGGNPIPGLQGPYSFTSSDAVVLGVTPDPSGTSCRATLLAAGTATLTIGLTRPGMQDLDYAIEFTAQEGADDAVDLDVTVGPAEAPGDVAPPPAQAARPGAGIPGRPGGPSPQDIARRVHGQPGR